MSEAEAIAALERRFGIPGIVRVIAGNGGLAKVLLTTPVCSGEIYLHGAHVTSWKPQGGVEVLFVSAQSRWEEGKAIRGGVPICFPWFANKPNNPQAPAHGFVRTKVWQLESIQQHGGGVTVSMVTESSAATKKWWSADFRLLLHATFGAELSLELVLTNMGMTPLYWEEALHSYFRVGQIEQTQLHGLHSVSFLDKTLLNRKHSQDGPVVIKSETDRIYLNTSDALELEDSALWRRIGLTKENSLTTVVWNPWIEKAKALTDFGDTEWKHMLCVETGNLAENALTLMPGQQHQMKTVISTRVMS